MVHVALIPPDPQVAVDHHVGFRNVSGDTVTDGALTQVAAVAYRSPHLQHRACWTDPIHTV